MSAASSIVVLLFQTLSDNECRNEEDRKTLYNPNTTGGNIFGIVTAAGMMIMTAITIILIVLIIFIAIISSICRKQSRGEKQDCKPYRYTYMANSVYTDHAVNHCEVQSLVNNMAFHQY